MNLTVWIPEGSTILEFRAQQGFVSQILHLFTASIDVSAQQTKHFIGFVHVDGNLLDVTGPVKIFTQLFTDLHPNG